MEPTCQTTNPARSTEEVDQLRLSRGRQLAWLVPCFLVFSSLFFWANFVFFEVNDLSEFLRCKASVPEIRAVVAPKISLGKERHSAL